MSDPKTMKYDKSLPEKLREGPMIVHITLDADMAARAYIGQITPSLIFSRIIHELMRLPFVTPTCSTTAVRRSRCSFCSARSSFEPSGVRIVSETSTAFTE